MGDFGTAEKRILNFMLKGTVFEYNNKQYEVQLINQHVQRVNLKQIFIFWQNLMRIQLK